MDKDEATRDRRPMKARPFLSAAGAVLLSLLLLAVGLLWTMNRQSPLQLAEQPLHPVSYTHLTLPTKVTV